MLSKPHVLQQSLLMLLMVRLVGHSYKIPAPCQMLVVAQTKKKKHTVLLRVIISLVKKAISTFCLKCCVERLKKGIVLFLRSFAKSRTNFVRQRKNDISRKDQL